jgi:hypothetical protein
MKIASRSVLFSVRRASSNRNSLRRVQLNTEVTYCGLSFRVSRDGGVNGLVNVRLFVQLPGTGFAANTPSLIPLTGASDPLAGKAHL